MPSAPDISELVGQLALDAIRTQQLLNATHLAESEQFARLLAAHPEMKSWLLPLAPVHMTALQFRISASVRLAMSRATEFKLTGRLINLEYSRRYEVSFENSSRIEITVEQYPAPPETNP